MDTETALVLIRPLADGINPFTGEVLGESDVFQQPQLVRALAAAVAALEVAELRERRARQLPKKAGLPWTPDDDEAISRDFDSGMDPGELASKHQRSRGAVEARLVKLGKLSGEAGRFRQ